MEKPRHFEGVKFEAGQGYLPDHDPLPAFNPQRRDPAAARSAEKVVDDFRQQLELCLPRERVDRLQQAIADAIHEARSER